MSGKAGDITPSKAQLYHNKMNDFIELLLQVEKFKEDMKTELIPNDLLGDVYIIDKNKLDEKLHELVLKAITVCKMPSVASAAPYQTAINRIIRVLDKK